ncbi:MAG: pepsin/retropepsin-like aspartic protease family protein [Candidatus Helarchaeales archaeon]
MVDGVYFRGNEIYGKIELESGTKRRILEGLIDTGAFKTLVPESICKALELPIVEIKTVTGICSTPLKVNIYFVKVYFLDDEVINSVIGFDIPSEKEICLIGRDILSQYDFYVKNSDKSCEIKRI